MESCKLPDWDYALVRGDGFQSFRLTDPAAIDPLYAIVGVTVWRGYDDPQPLGVATGAEEWVTLMFRRTGLRRTLALIQFTQNEAGVYCWWFPSMKITTDKNGKHKGWHPRFMAAVPRPFVVDWLAAVTPIVSEG